MEMKVLALFMLLAIAAYSVQSSIAIEDSGGLPIEAGDGISSNGGEKWCKHMCVCTRSFPPQCRCWDRGVSCLPGCHGCLCTRSNPPMCWCTDVRDYC